MELEGGPAPGGSARGEARVIRVRGPARERRATSNGGRRGGGSATVKTPARAQPGRRQRPAGRLRLALSESLSYKMDGFPAPLPFAPMYFPMVATDRSWIDHHAELLENMAPASSGFMSLFEDFRCPVVMFPAAPPISGVAAGDIEMASLKSDNRRQSFFSGLASRISAAMSSAQSPDESSKEEEVRVEDQIKFLENGQEATWHMAGEASKKVI